MDLLIIVILLVGFAITPPRWGRRDEVDRLGSMLEPAGSGLVSGEQSTPD
jgi:hypothetical protein